LQLLIAYLAVASSCCTREARNSTWRPWTHYWTFPFKAYEQPN